MAEKTESTVPFLEVAGLTKTYGRPPVETHVLRGVSLSMQEGDAVAIMGASGSGKSTLLNIIGALDEPSGGHVRFEGTSLAAMGERERAALRRTAIGFVFQRHCLLPQCSAIENVMVPCLADRNRVDEASQERAERLVKRVGLWERRHARPSELSGGECQRVAVVRALIRQPCLILADEPTGSLDRKSADALGDLLCELNREEAVALLMVTHAESMARRLGRVLVLEDGRLEPSQEKSAR